jgi:hypothetical protein
MIKDAVANRMSDQAGVRFEVRTSRINRILQLLFALDVSLRRLDGSVPEQKTNLFSMLLRIHAERLVPANPPQFSSQ